MSDVTPVLVPRMNPNDEHAVLVSWHMASGEWVEAEQTLATVETTKATYDIDAPRAGYAYFNQAPKSLVPVGAPIVWICDRNEQPLMEAETSPTRADGEATEDRSRFSRKALQLMKQHGLSEADFPASGRIAVADVERMASRRPAKVPPAVTSDEIATLEQSPAKVLEVARLSAVYKHVIPSTVVVAVSCEAVNTRLRKLAERVGPISLLELAIHDAARILRDFPELNGFYADGQASRYTAIRIGFAVNLGKSLRVPVVRDAEKLSPADVARSVRDLSLRYLRSELTAADVADGTFTITDLSGQSVVHFIPVLNFRQSAILGISAERPYTGYRELVLTFDHRMTDGMQAAAFLVKLRDRLTSESVD